MKYNEAKCPKCGGVLQVPQDLEKLICMYCGKEINANELISLKDEDTNTSKENESELLNLWESGDIQAITKAKDLFEVDRFNYVANYILALDGLPKLVLEHKDLQSKFKIKLYEDAMKEYMIDSRPTVEYLERVCTIKKGDRTIILKEAAEFFVGRIKEDMLKATNNNLKKLPTVMDDYKTVLVLFTIPMILELHLDISDELADIIIEAWINEFPKNIIRKGNFENINSGFRRKGFCYITTAVCESLHKSDDCYELTMFRDFRDNYLLKQEDGISLIHEYYDKAPSIVENINSFEDNEKIYQSIWRDHLKGCLEAIELGDDARCKIQYSNMVIELQKKYYSNS